MAKLIATKKHLMPETEWRAMGIQQSQGWIHYMYHKPGKKRYRAFDYLSLEALLWLPYGILLVTKEPP